MIEMILAFIPLLLRGFLIDLWIALAATVIGLAIGLPIAWVRHRMAWTRRPLRVVIRLMQAAPVYVVMFFLLNMLPDDVEVWNWTIVIGGITVMILAQCAYMIPYVAEAGFDMLCHLREGEIGKALLFSTNASVEGPSALAISV